MADESQEKKKKTQEGGFAFWLDTGFKLLKSSGPPLSFRFITYQIFLMGTCLASRQATLLTRLFYH